MVLVIEIINIMFAFVALLTRKFQMWMVLNACTQRDRLCGEQPHPLALESRVVSQLKNVGR